MATLADLKVAFDVPEPRVRRGRLTLSCDGTAWDLDRSANVWVDPITRTAFLTPVPLSPQWQFDGTGPRARLRKSDYVLGVPDDWMEVPRRFAEDYFLENGKGARVQTVQSMLANQPMFVSLYVPGVQDMAEQTIFKFGWGDETTNGVWCRLRADGSMIVYIGNNRVGTYSVSGSGNSPLKGKGGGSNALAQQTVSLIAIPCRQRELLVVTSWGDGFSHTFNQLPLASGNTITPAGRFWWQSTGYGSVQCAKVQFATLGMIYGPLKTFRFAPVAADSWTDLPAWDAAGPNPASVGLTVGAESESGANFLPDGIQNKARVKVTLNGSGTTSPSLYAVDRYSTPAPVTTANATVDVTELVADLSISVPEHGGATCTITGYDPDAWEEKGVEFPQNQGDRPFAIQVGGVDILRGSLAAPVHTLGLGKAGSIGDVLKWDGADRSDDMFLQQMPDAIPYDGLTLKDAVTDLLGLSGYGPQDVTVYDDGFVLPYTPGVSTGEWELLPQREDNLAQFIENITSRFAANWFQGWVPTLTGYKFYVRPPDSLGTTPVMDLFHSFGDAQAAGIASQLIPARLVQTWEITRKAPEANHIDVVGQDPQTHRYIYSFYNDVASQEPTTLPQNRPDNWRGRVAAFQLTDPAIRTQAAADRALDVLTERLTVERVFASWTGDFLVRSSDKRPLWKTDVVRVHEPGRTAWADWRIIAIPRIDLVRVWEHGTVNASFSMNCQYAAERIATGTGVG